MSQTIGLVQTQREAQLQKLTPQQLLLVRLLEMPIVDLEQRVKNETFDNPALEEGRGFDDNENDNIGGDEDGNDNYDEYEYDDDYSSANSDIRLGDYASSDDIPDYLQRQLDAAVVEPLPIGDTVSFLDDLREQIMDFDLTEHQTTLVDYLIGSLNDNGFIEQPLYRIADEMLFDHDIDTNETELEEALAILQQFDPAGIGARNTQESLLLQIDRKLSVDNLEESKEHKLRLERQIISDEYDNFKNRNYEKIASNLNIDRKLVDFYIEDIKKTLNPRPGIALCESAGDRAQVAIPDFIVETDAEGTINCRLNRGELPSLHVSQQYRELADKYSKKGDRMNRHDKEQLMDLKHKLDSAQMFIDAIAQRQHTLTSTMQAIISFQKSFFLSQNPDDLQTLIYKDVADKAKLDISTVSRVCKTKYALIDGRMYPLSFFFKHNRKNNQGEDVISDAVGEALKQIVDEEDKKHPFSDEQIVEELKKKGINIARRTVNKYRAELAIPNAMKRKS